MTKEEFLGLSKKLPISYLSFLDKAFKNVSTKPIKRDFSGQLFFMTIIIFSDKSFHNAGIFGGFSYIFYSA